jgi:hypothetical protein
MHEPDKNSCNKRILDSVYSVFLIASKEDSIVKINSILGYVYSVVRIEYTVF